MDKWKKVLKKFLYPPLWIIWPLIPIAVILLVFGLSDRFEGTALAYISYLVSAYTLTIVILDLPKRIRILSKEIRNLSVMERISRHPIGQSFIKDRTFRHTASIYQGLAINTLYAVFRGIGALLYRSVWFAAIAAYYLFLGMVRLSLVYHVRRLKQYESPAAREEFEWKGYRLCGFLMLLLHTGMAGMAVLMIRDNQHVEYPGYVIYLSAAYTFYTAITSTVNVFKFRKMKSPILSASKAIAFTGAMMSVMALQTAMIARFGAEDAAFRQMANTITGSVVCITSVVMAIWMMVRSSRVLKHRRIHKTQT